MYVHKHRLPAVTGYIEDCPAVLSVDKTTGIKQMEEFVDKTVLINEMVYCNIFARDYSDFLRVLKQYVLLNDNRLKANQVISINDSIDTPMQRANVISVILRMLDEDKPLLPEIMLLGLCTVEFEGPIDVPADLKVRMEDFVMKTRLSKNYKTRHNYRLDSFGAIHFMKYTLNYIVDKCFVDGDLAKQPFGMIDSIFLLVGFLYGSKDGEFKDTNIFEKSALDLLVK